MWFRRSQSPPLHQHGDESLFRTKEEVDNAVDSLASLIEPMIMAVLGVLVGGLIVAMYLPIFKMGDVF